MNAFGRLFWLLEYVIWTNGYSSQGQLNCQAEFEDGLFVFDDFYFKLDKMNYFWPYGEEQIQWLQVSIADLEGDILTTVRKAFQEWTRGQSKKTYWRETVNKSLYFRLENRRRNNRIRASFERNQ